MEERRVVITGMGLCTPIGVGKDAFWEAAKKGTSGTAYQTLVENENVPVKIVGEVKNWEPTQFMNRKLVVRTDRNTQFAFACCGEALADSGLDLEAEDKTRIGMVMACNYGGLSYYLDNLVRLHQKGPSFVSAYMAIAWIPSAPVGQLSIFYGTSGYTKTVVNDSAAGIDAIGTAYRAIRRGESDVIITGGFEGAIAEASLAALSTFEDVVRDVDDPAAAYRPFDQDRRGMVIAEGGGIFILEELERARARGAPIYGEVVGFAQTSDDFDLMSVAPDGEQYARCMRLALRNGGLTPDDVGYVNADGRATAPGDRGEARALLQAFGERASNSLPISAPKSMTGNALAGAGPMDLAFTVLAMRDGVVAPTINLQRQDPECGICLITEPGHRAAIDVALVTGRGTSGVNSSLVLKRAE
jgi:3-oxoacyl-[acyl-carrier-protein] synthase II